ncbi:intracellular coagulation inhibitor 1-like [Uloborus diversus]|uniref:intracellular coagulation inhibitor 1-like n=1 Tax=Uloborus diversus TaxID=327109 RepID=UPI00240963AC|nr:intracellular coagulation inhibitor 1-like [Uloborus diversus]XP_054708795.1 intracellular coagulation inhibitor 1-like [Uloborus diversus]
MTVMRLQFFILLTVYTLCTADGNFVCRKPYLPVSDIINTFSERLTNRIGNEGNYFFSPLSISMTLAMVYLGTRGETRDQMSSALHYNILGGNCLGTRVGEDFKELISLLNDENNKSSLLTANGVFIHTGHNVTKHYTSDLRKYFESSVEYLPFAEEEMKSLEKINRWINDHTNGTISKLINEPLDPMTVMVVMNAIYFKGYWSTKFPEMSTYNTFFNRKNGTRKLAPFMMQQESFRYYKDSTINYTFLELDYAGSNFSMLLILPKDASEFPNFSLSSTNLCYLQTQMKMTNVMVVLPKFKMEYARELSKDMSNMGMDKLFSDKADLTGIREDGDLHVSLMVHKAMIVVDESGAEASAVTAIGINGRMKNPQASFFADHPFQFYIIDKKTNTILFSGRVVEP